MTFWGVKKNPVRQEMLWIILLKGLGSMYFAIT